MPSTHQIAFEHPHYQRMLPQWRKALHVWNGLRDQDVKCLYLPKAAGEMPNGIYDPYLERIRLTEFDNKFKPALQSHAGLLSDFSLLKNTPEAIAQHARNIDNKGHSLKVFLKACDEIAMRDLATVLIVDMPKVENIRSEAERRAIAPRPYVVRYPLRNCINWEFEESNGVEMLTRLVIKRARYRQGQNYLEYLEYRPGQVTVYKSLLDKTGRATGEMMGEGDTSVILDATGKQLSEILFVWYPAVSIDPFAYAQEDDAIGSGGVFAELPFASLLDLNIKYLRKENEKDHVMFKCNLPQPVMKDPSQVPNVSGGNALTISPNQVINLFHPQADYYYAEPKGTALSQTMQDLQTLKDDMDKAAESFLTGGETFQTATRSLLDNAQSKSSLRGMIELKEMAVRRLFSHWIKLTYRDYAAKIANDEIGGIEISDSVLDLPQPISVRDLIDLKTEGSLTDQELRNQLKYSGRLYEEFDPEKPATMPGMEGRAIAPLPDNTNLEVIS
jgi:hypothetical protein